LRASCSFVWSPIMNAPPNPKLAKMFGAVRTGGKGTVRRKKKVVHKTTTTDDKRLQNTLKRLGINSIPAIEEVNLFLENGEVIHFTNPKVQASIAANTYVIIGHAETKKLQDLFPGILNQVDKSVLPSLKKIAEQYSQGAEVDDDDDDDDVPDLVENFEAASKTDKKPDRDFLAEKMARKAAEMPDVDEDLVAQLRKKAQGAKMTDEEKKARGLLYDTSKASGVREESDSDDDGACDLGGDPFEGM